MRIIKLTAETRKDILENLLKRSPNSYKEYESRVEEIVNAVKEAVLRLDKGANVVVKPLADGGEGTVEALSESANAQVIELTVHGPRLRSITARYCILQDTNTAVIEMAAAAGITLVALSKVLGCRVEDLLEYDLNEIEEN